jgi:hypothetical protein
MWTRSKTRPKVLSKKLKIFDLKPNVLFLLLRNELTFICAKKEKNQTKSNVFAQKIKTSLRGSIEQQEWNNIV